MFKTAAPRESRPNCVYHTVGSWTPALWRHSRDRSAQAPTLRYRREPGCGQTSRDNADRLHLVSSFRVTMRSQSSGRLYLSDRPNISLRSVTRKTFVGIFKLLERAVRLVKGLSETPYPNPGSAHRTGDSLRGGARARKILAIGTLVTRRGQGFQAG